MADMTQKHHVLIQDAINETLAKCEEVIGRRTIQCSVSKEDAVAATKLCMREIKIAVGNAFASRLRYTSNDFDGPKFCAGLRP